MFNLFKLFKATTTSSAATTTSSAATTASSTPTTASNTTTTASNTAVVFSLPTVTPNASAGSLSSLNQINASTTKSPMDYLNSIEKLVNKTRKNEEDINGRVIINRANAGDITDYISKLKAEKDPIEVINFSDKLYLIFKKSPCHRNDACLTLLSDFLSSSIQYDKILKLGLNDLAGFDNFNNSEKRKLKAANVKLGICRVMEKSDEAKAFLNSPDLKEILIEGVNAQYLNLEKLDLENVNLSNANLSNANLSNTNLSNANLSNANLSNADLSNADLSNADLSHANLSNTNMNGANLNDIYSYRTNFKKANLKNATAFKANFSYSNLEDVNLDEAKKLERTKWFNATVNWDTLPVLNYDQKIIDFKTEQEFIIKDHEVKDKIPERLQRQIIYFIEYDWGRDTKLNNEWLSAFINSNAIEFMNVSDLVKPLIYMIDKSFTNDAIKNDPKVRDFIVKKLMPAYFQSYKDSSFPSLTQEMINLLSNVKNPLEIVQTKHNSLFNRFIFEISKKNPDLATKLYKEYLQIPEIKSFFDNGAIHFFGNMAIANGEPDWTGNEHFNFIFLSDEFDNNQYNIVEEKYLCLKQESFKTIVNLHDELSRKIKNGETFTKSEKSIIKNAFSDIHVYNQNVEQIRESNDHLFSTHFKFFHYLWKIANNETQYEKLLSFIFGEHNTLMINGQKVKFENIFYDAATKKSSDVKLNSPEHQSQLYKMLSPYKEIDEKNKTHFRIKPEHYENIIKTLLLDKLSDSKKAKSFFCLSLLFVKYSSASIFGTESESPYALRHLAFAFLQKACELDPTMIIQTEFNDFRDRLLGLNNAFSCANILYDDMQKYAKKHFKAVFEEVIPVAWW